MNIESILKTEKTIPLQTRSIIHTILVTNKINEAMSLALKPFEISRQQFNVLRILKGQNGKPSNLCTLNERMVNKMSNTTRLVDKLITKGFVERVTCEHNRRKVEITITKKGTAILPNMSEAISKVEKKLLQNFTDSDLEQLNKLLNKF